MLSIVVAVDQNLGIGVKNKLLCHLPNDLKNFKNITTGGTIIMGRKTYDSLPIKPLPNRQNIVVSRTIENLLGSSVVSNLQEIKDWRFHEEEYFVIGGAEIYRELLPFADKMYMTVIQHVFDEADTFFPDLCSNEWRLISGEMCRKDEKHAYDYKFEVWERC